MSQKTFSLIAGIIFTLVCFAHLWRAAAGWPLIAGGMLFPIWASWVAGIVAGILAFYGLRFGTGGGK
jgi:hypothetical protein